MYVTTVSSVQILQCFSMFYSVNGDSCSIIETVYYQNILFSADNYIYYRNKLMFGHVCRASASDQRIDVGTRMQTENLLYDPYNDSRQLSAN